jgi:hypothetical protein
MYLIQPRYILFKLKYDLTAFGGSKKSDNKKTDTPSLQRGNRGGGKLK